jgi:mRNA interferase MazF
MTQRGEIWEVRFDPSEGDEIRKIRPAVIINLSGVGRAALRIVVPITGWQPSFARFFWMVKLVPASANGLSKESAANASQVKSVSTTRFIRKLGDITADELQDIVDAVIYCIVDESEQDS